MMTFKWKNLIKSGRILFTKTFILIKKYSWYSICYKKNCIKKVKTVFHNVKNLLFALPITARIFVPWKSTRADSNENGHVFWICSWDFNFQRILHAESRSWHPQQDLRRLKFCEDRFSTALVSGEQTAFCMRWKKKAGPRGRPDPLRKCAWD